MEWAMTSSIGATEREGSEKRKGIGGEEEEEA
jgi:hypothetical protein